LKADRKNIIGGKEKKEGILFKVGDNLIIHDSSIYKPKLFRGLYIPVLNVDRNQAKII
jgi:hypothetical protein